VNTYSILDGPAASHLGTAETGGHRIEVQTSVIGPLADFNNSNGKLNHVTNGSRADQGSVTFSKSLFVADIPILMPKPITIGIVDPYRPATCSALIRKPRVRETECDHSLWPVVFLNPPLRVEVVPGQVWDPTVGNRAPEADFSA